MDSEAKTQHYYSNCKERHYSHPVIQEFSQPKLNWILSKINLNNLKVLEVGAGNGYFSHLLINICYLTVLDISKHQLNSNPAKKKIVGSVYKLPFEDNSFDVVFCSNLLHHLNFPEEALNEMRRVTKSKIILSEPNRKNPLLFIGALFTPTERRVIFYSKRFLSEMIKKFRMHIIAHTYIGGLVVPNITPKFLLSIAGSRSRSSLSCFQIFICEK